VRSCLEACSRNNYWPMVTKSKSSLLLAVVNYHRTAYTLIHIESIT
jgi:hypothetical protein